MTSRRRFLTRIGGAAAAAAVLPRRELSTVLDAASPDDIKIGYAAITWGGDDTRAIDEIGAVGYRGIQLRANVLTRYGDRPRELRDLLARHELTFVALSSGNVSIDPAREASVIEEHVNHARFLRDAGGLYLQLIDERPAGRAVEAADYTRLGGVLTEIGRRASDLGVAVGYPPHMGSMGETPEQIARVLEASDPAHVRLLLDVAHYQQGGGDPVAAIRRYGERLLFLHIKDLRQLPAAASGPRFQFVELGRGTVDLRGVFASLHDARFRGWAVVELDSVTEPGETPKRAAEMSKRYLEHTLKIGVS